MQNENVTDTNPTEKARTIGFCAGLRSIASLGRAAVERQLAGLEEARNFFAVLELYAGETTEEHARLVQLCTHALCAEPLVQLSHSLPIVRAARAIGIEFQVEGAGVHVDVAQLARELPLDALVTLLAEAERPKS